MGISVPALSFIAPFQFRQSTAQAVFPLTLCYVGMLVFNNICLQYVEVTFYQVARSLSILFNILFTYTILGKATSSQAVIACLIIFAGFIVGSYGEINFSWIGILSGVASSCFVALYGIYVKKTLTIVDNNEWCGRRLTRWQRMRRRQERSPPAPRRGSRVTCLPLGRQGPIALHHGDGHRAVAAAGLALWRGATGSCPLRVSAGRARALADTLAWHDGCPPSLAA